MNRERDMISEGERKLLKALGGVEVIIRDCTVS